MDLLFKRYASPFLLVDEMIAVGQFSEFVSKITEYDSDQSMWEFFLHRVDGQSFNDWKNSISGNAKQQITKEQIETTINDSYIILNNFEPV